MDSKVKQKTIIQGNCCSFDLSTLKGGVGVYATSLSS